MIEVELLETKQKRYWETPNKISVKMGKSPKKNTRNIAKNDGNPRSRRATVLWQMETAEFEVFGPDFRSVHDLQYTNLA